MSLKQRNIPISLPATGDEEWEATKICFESGWLTQGDQVVSFQNEFSRLHGVKHSIATTSCTTGLHLALTTLGVGPGDEVIVPAFTWVSTANVVLYCGATPVFVDVDKETYNIDIAQVKQKLSDKTKAIIPVHLFGRCVEMDALRRELPDSVAIIEDAACAVGASYKGRMAGSLGTAGVFSFHPRKIISTGEGGMLTTDDDSIADKVTRLRNHGCTLSEEQRHLGPKPYLFPDFTLLGFNYRMTDIQGAVGLVQLKKLDGFIRERQHWAEYYHEELSSLEWLSLPAIPSTGQHGWQAFVCYVNPESASMSRTEIMEYLHNLGVSTRPGTHAIHMLGYYQERFNFKPEDFPAAKDCHHQTLAIPLHNRMQEDDYAYIVSVLKSL